MIITNKMLLAAICDLEEELAVVAEEIKSLKTDMAKPKSHAKRPVGRPKKS